MITGYSHPLYAESLAEFGFPRKLPGCGGQILKRQVPGQTYYDAMGSYPLFLCQDWSRLGGDIAALAGEVICLSMVTDPFGAYSESLLKSCFDRVVPFKQHFVADLSVPIVEIVSKHHAYYVRRASREVTVDICGNPTDCLEAWIRLYSVLKKRHQIQGISGFSDESFRKQFEVPGLVLFTVSRARQIIGAHMWYVSGEIAYSHLRAFDESAYSLRAAYPMYQSALEYFRGKVKWLNLGSVAGVESRLISGLAEFKKGWSTGTRPAYFCGKVLDAKRYASAAKKFPSPPRDYFPAYRFGEYSIGPSSSSDGEKDDHAGR